MLHSSQSNIGAELSTVGHNAANDGPKGYPPGLLAANTYTDGDPFSIVGARSLVLIAMTGAATGSPTAQSHVLSLETAPAGTASGGTWTAYSGASVTLTGDEKAGRADVSLGALPEGHSIARVKVVVGFTEGTSPKQSVCAQVVLGGYEVLPVAR